MNEEYEYSPTYPRWFAVPRSISDKELEGMRRSNGGQHPFRSKVRIPALTYYHRSNGAVLLRSSQPMTGMGGLGGFVSTSWWSQNRCIEDERLLAAAEVKFIVDARPKMNAVVNQAAGGGYENTAEFYKGIDLLFGNIQNIHKVRESLEGLRKAIAASNRRHYQSLHVPHVKWLRIKDGPHRMRFVCFLRVF